MDWKNFFNLIYRKFISYLYWVNAQSTCHNKQKVFFILYIYIYWPFSRRVTSWLIFDKYSEGVIIFLKNFLTLSTSNHDSILKITIVIWWLPSINVWSMIYYMEHKFKTTKVIAIIIMMSIQNLNCFGKGYMFWI